MRSFLLLATTLGFYLNSFSLVASFVFGASFHKKNSRASILSGGAAAPSQQQPHESLHMTPTPTTDTPATTTTLISSNNWALLSDRGRAALEQLFAFGDAQAHVYQNWPQAGTDDAGKIQLTEQVRNKCMCMFRN
jgi:hypothetical protein